MKISGFILKLQEVLEKHGDVDVCVFEPDNFKEGELVEGPAVISQSVDLDGKVTGITIVDIETAMSFDSGESADEDDGDEAGAEA